MNAKIGSAWVTGLGPLMLIEPPSQESWTIYLVMLAGAIIAVIAAFAFVQSRLDRIIDARLNDPESPLGTHMADEKAHEPMRDKVWERLDQKFSKISESIDNARKEQHADFLAFQSGVIAPIMKQNEVTLSLLARTMDRERRFEARKDDEDKGG